MTDRNTQKSVWSSPYLTGLLLFAGALIVGVCTYHDYGMSWDEIRQRELGLINYDYIFNGSTDLLTFKDRFYGAGFELPLIFLEKLFGLTDLRDIFLMRHLVSHLFFLTGALAGYVLAIRLFRNRFVAVLAFVMLAFTPRMYAHSFFNTKDVPLLTMFIITFAFARFAFVKNRYWWYGVLGLLCGYTASLRVTGVLLFGLLGLFLVMDAWRQRKVQPASKGMVHIAAFVAGFLATLLLCWPYLWSSPVSNFLEAYRMFSHFDWQSVVLLNGQFEESGHLPWYYFPLWFAITVPEVWLAAGVAGMVWILYRAAQSPKVFTGNTPDRNFLLYFLGFFVPVIAVIGLHAIIYDDWRHLYFVYPAFVFAALYMIHSLLQTGARKAVQVACILQAGMLAFFLVADHPFGQLYFNDLVPHTADYLRNHYELDYWGSGYKQALQHILAADKGQTIYVNGNCDQPLVNNIAMLPEEDRNRLRYDNSGKADYYITNYRQHPYDYPPEEVVYDRKVLNSSVLTVFKVEKDSAKRSRMLAGYITGLRRELAADPASYLLHDAVANAFLSNAEYDSALVHFIKAMDLRPGFFKADDIAVMFTDRGQDRQAAMMYRFQISKDPGDVQAHYNLAACIANMRMYDGAVAEFRKVIEIAPEYEQYRSFENMARLYRVMGVPDSAIRYGSIARRYNPAFRW